MPTISTASASDVIALLCSPNMWPSWPRKSGWVESMLTSEEFAPQTCAPSSSATRVSSGCAPDQATPSPMITIGRELPESSSATRATASPVGATRVSSREVGTACSCAGASRTSIGSATKTGPQGGVDATLIARRKTRNSDDGSTTRVDHFVTGLAIATRSAAICASSAS